MKETLTRARLGSVLTGLALMIGTSAIACPVAEDLNRGISLVYTDGSVENVRRLDADRVELIVPSVDGVLPMRDVLAQGLYLMRSSDYIDGKDSDVMALDYGMAAGDMPVPRAGETVNLVVREDWAGDVQTFVEIYRAGAAKDVTIGDCTYRAFDVKLTRNDGSGDGLAIEVMRYFPELGFSHIHAIGDAGSPLEYYELARIEAVQ